MKKRNFTEMIDEIKKTRLGRHYKHEYGITRYVVDGKNKSVIINAPSMNILGRKVEKDIVNLLKEDLINIFDIRKYQNICVVGLGNREILNDALGPKVLQKLLVTRGLNIQPELCMITPNVYSQTGIESADLIKSVCNSIKPDLVVFIDALTTTSLERLCSSFQVTNRGIQAGSGNNLNNKKMTKKFLNCDVISIGVPMLIYVESFLAKELISEKTKNLIMSPCDIKKILNLLSDIISQSLNCSIFPQFSKEEADMLIN